MIHYIVQSGDTLAKIAGAHGTTAPVLLAANPYAVSKAGDPKTLRVGVVIHIQGSSPPVEPPGPERVDVYSISSGLDRWREKVKNPTGRDLDDWDRIIFNRDAFASDPHPWPGLAHGWPNAIINDGTGDEPPDKAQWGAPEYVRDTAFHALVTGDPRHLAAVKANLLAVSHAPRNDFTNRTRYNPDNQGTGFNPGWLLALYLKKLSMAYGYVMAADPSLWTTAERVEFLDWLWSIGPWLGDGGSEALIHRRRDGWSDPTTGAATAPGAKPDTTRMWAGGPNTLVVHRKVDNHVAGVASTLCHIAALARLEEARGVRSAVDVDKGFAYGRWITNHYLSSEMVPAAAGDSGGQGTGPRTGFGQFYRRDEVDAGWKYAVEWFGHVSLCAEALAQAGDTSLYDFATTDGTGITVGSVPDDTYYSNPGPKTLHRAAQQLARYVIETGLASHPWRYAHTTNTTVGYRIDSDGTGVDGYPRSQDVGLILANSRWADPKLAAVYTRTAAGTPPHPTNPRQGRWWVENGPGGTFPGVWLQYGPAG